MKILVTGGTGYIGSHTCVELLENNYEIVVVDDFSNSKKDVIDKIKQIAKKDFAFYEGNCKDSKIMIQIFTEHQIDAVINFAGFKAVGESVLNPLTGNGYSVLDIVNTFSRINKVDIPYQITERRPGDIDSCYSDPKYSEEKLKWKAEYGIEEMCLDSYNSSKFQKINKKVFIFDEIFAILSKYFVSP